MPRLSAVALKWDALCGWCDPSAVPLPGSRSPARLLRRETASQSASDRRHCGRHLTSEEHCWLYRAPNFVARPHVRWEMAPVLKAGKGLQRRACFSACAGGHVRAFSVVLAALVLTTTAGLLALSHRAAWASSSQIRSAGAGAGSYGDAGIHVPVPRRADRRPAPHSPSQPPHHITAAHTSRGRAPQPTTTWKTTAAKLCPGQVPALALAPAVFRAAQRAAGLPERNVAEQAMRFHKFVARQYAARVGNTIAVYQAHWKCANNQVADYMRAWIKESRPPLPAAGGQDRGSHEEVDAFLANSTKREGGGRRLAVCAFGVLRDPVSHFLSGYNEIEYRIKNTRRGALPLQRPGFQRVPGGSAARFEAFVKGLLQGEWAEKKLYSKTMMYHHVSLMSGVLTTGPAASGIRRWMSEYGAPPAHFAMVETVMEDVPVILQSKCQLPPHAVPPMELRGQHNSSTDPHGHYRAAKEAVAAGGPVVDALCILHAMDYACFPQLLVPVMCRRVLGSLDLGQGTSRPAKA